MLIPGATDKRGRPVIVARARNHDPNCDFIEILTLLVYARHCAQSSIIPDVIA